jgi:hypothetical protein
MLNFPAQCVQEGQIQVSFEPPDHCPLCHTTVDPRPLLAMLKRPSAARRLQVLLQCTKASCDSLFVAYYSGTPATTGHQYTFERSAPVTAQTASFTEEISQLSPLFVDIYNQALAAEAENLQHLTGIGLRKALEFLVKDFAIKEHPADQAAIENTQLGGCIEQYINDTNVKECAKRAAWLGNDETHYVRKWTDKDVRDLKVLITLTINWINNVLLTRKYTAEMQ